MDVFLPEFADWSRRGHDLNHNWLDKLADLVCSADAAPGLLLEWPEKYPKLLKWLDEATCAVSPAQLLEVSEFDSWPPEFRAEASNWIHERFLQSDAALSEVVADAQRKLKTLDARVRGVLSQPSVSIAQNLRTELADDLESIARQIQLSVPREIRFSPLESELPLILVIDDILGRSAVKFKGEPVLSPAALKQISEQRQAFCTRFHVLDAEESANSASVQGPIACAYFCPGQRWDPAEGYKNDPSVAEEWFTSRAGRDGQQSAWALVLVDVWFNVGRPDEKRAQKDTKFGISDLIPWIRKDYPDFPVLALTSESGTEFINRIQSLGVPYLHRSSSSNVDLLTHIMRGGKGTSAQLRAAIGLSDDLVAEDARMLEVVFQAWLAAHDKRRLNILHVGESGVGKEELARFIHRCSDRATKPFQPVHCAQFTKELAESELFGFYKGAFDGANADTEGFFQQADGGTLFLDEFADLDEKCQAKLLRVLQYEGLAQRVVQPRGQPQGPSKLRTRVDVRIICATDQSLEHIRPALLNRIDIHIQIPPLRERPGDIVPLACHFIRSPKYLAAPGLELNDEAGEYLRNAFGEGAFIQGNARTLRRLIQEAVVGKGSRGIITRSDLEAALPRVQAPIQSRSQPEPSILQSLRIAPHVRSPIGDAVAKLMAYFESGFDWGVLTQGEIEELDRTLDGHVTEVVGTLVQWALFRRSNAPSLVKYLTGRELKHRAPEDVIKKILQVDPKIAERAANSKFLPENLRLKKVIESEAERWARRTAKKRKAPDK